MRATLYQRWIVANGAAEALGLGTTFALGVGLAPYLETLTTTAAILGAGVVAVVLGVALEGVLVGAAQTWALGPDLPDLRPSRWILATAAGAGLAWLLGMIPSSLMALVEEGGDAAAASWEPEPLAQAGFAAVLGLVLGPVLGAAQWIVLRVHVRGASRWLLANACAWGVGMPVIFLGMDFLPWETRSGLLFAGLYGICLLAGVVVGVVHGWWLLQLLDESGTARRPDYRRAVPTGRGPG